MLISISHYLLANHDVPIMSLFKQLFVAYTLQQWSRGGDGQYLIKAGHMTWDGFLKGKPG